MFHFKLVNRVLLKESCSRALSIQFPDGMKRDKSVGAGENRNLYDNKNNNRN